MITNEQIGNKANDFSILYAHEFGALHKQIEEDSVSIAKWARDQQPKTIESLENQLQASRQTEEINGKWYEDMINDLKAQKEIDRQEIERLKNEIQLLRNIAQI